MGPKSTDARSRLPSLYSELQPLSLSSPYAFFIIPESWLPSSGAIAACTSKAEEARAVGCSKCWGSRGSCRTALEPTFDDHRIGSNGSSRGGGGCRSSRCCASCRRRSDAAADVRLVCARLRGRFFDAAPRLRNSSTSENVEDESSASSRMSDVVERLRLFIISKQGRSADP